MKAKTRKLVCAVVCLTVAPLFFGSATAEGPAKDPIYGIGSSMLVPAPPPEGVMMQFSGWVDLLVRGEVVNTELLVNLYSSTENPAHVQHALASHMMTFPDGSTITTEDMEVVKPTNVPGIYKVNAEMQVISGTGRYEGVSGHLTAHGTVDFSGLPAISFELRGAISAPAEE